LRQLARARDLASVVVVFEPQPREFFQPTLAPPRLSRLREKLGLLAAEAVDKVLLLRFDAKLAALEAEAFVRNVLVEGLRTRAVLIGDDFRFGSGRRGNIDLLRRLGGEAGFSVEATDSFVTDGQRVSSSLVRESLADGDLERAGRLLGRPYCMEGRVVHGDKRGRGIGFPTLNIDLHRRRLALAGIFAARVRGLGEEPISGMAYIGNRPVVNGRKVVLEVNLFDYSDECYGRHVSVEFVRKLRDDMNFASLDLLQIQLAADREQALQVLGGTM
jgi:riboflavin kinase/FMN adenylyltransferase